MHSMIPTSHIPSERNLIWGAFHRFRLLSNMCESWFTYVQVGLVMSFFKS